MFAQIAYLGLDLLARLLRQENLAAVSRRRDSRAQVHVVTHVALLAHVWRAGVDPYPDLDRPGSERLLGGVRGRDRLRRLRKDDEEGVALCVDLDPAVRSECVA